MGEIGGIFSFLVGRLIDWREEERFIVFRREKGRFLDWFGVVGRRLKR